MRTEDTRNLAMKADTHRSARATQSIRVRLAPELPELGSLGVDSARALLDEQLPRPHARLEASGETWERLLLPLPGTPHAPGAKLTEAPRGAGTGWVTLQRWQRAPIKQLLGLRFGAPPSASVAERHWNLLCHLRAQGIGTPEPWAVGARGSGLFSRDSFLVTRALEAGTLRLDHLIGGENGVRPSLEALRFAAQAIASSLRALSNARVILPRLDAKGLWARFSSHSHRQDIGQDDPGCGLTQLADWRAERALGGLQRDPRPAVLVSEMEGGHFVKMVSSDAKEALLARIEDSLPGCSGEDQDRSKAFMEILRAANLSDRQS